MFFGSLLISCCCCLLLVSGTDVVFNMDGANATISTLEAKIKKLEKTIANLKVRILCGRLWEKRKKKKEEEKKKKKKAKNKKVGAS